MSADELNRIGEKVKAAGMTFGYHNHDPEFGSEDGVIFYDELLRLTDPKLVVFEMDCGWVVAAGREPGGVSEQVAGALPAAARERHGAGSEWRIPLHGDGQGSDGLPAILRAATGLKHYFIEQEDFDMDPIDAIRLDAEYMRKLKL